MFFVLIGIGRLLGADYRPTSAISVHLYCEHYDTRPNTAKPAVSVLSQVCPVKTRQNKITHVLRQLHWLPVW